MGAHSLPSALESQGLPEWNRGFLRETLGLCETDSNQGTWRDCLPHPVSHIAAVTKYHKLSGLKYKLQLCSQKSKMSLTGLNC